MKRLVLSALLLLPCSFDGSEYPDIIACYLDGVQMANPEKHERVERALLSFEGMDKDEIAMVMGYLCMILQEPRPCDDCACDSCCDDILAEVNADFAQYDFEK